MKFLVQNVLIFFLRILATSKISLKKFIQDLLQATKQAIIYFLNQNFDVVLPNAKANYTHVQILREDSKTRAMTTVRKLTAKDEEIMEEGEVGLGAEALMACM